MRGSQFYATEDILASAEQRPHAMHSPISLEHEIKGAALETNVITMTIRASKALA